MEDETSYVNFGNAHARSYMQFELKQNEFSSWTEYPDRYKFFSFTVELNPNVKKTDRITCDLLEFVSNIGGAQ